VKRHVKEVFSRSIVVAPHEPSAIPAAKAAFALAVPLVLVTVTGHAQWSMYAAFGAFCAVFGRYDSYAPRFWQQLSVGVVQLSAMVLGTFFSMIHAPFYVCAVVLAVIGFGANYVSHAARWLPPGPIFAVFAGGACISVPATASSFVGVLLVGGGTIIFSLLFMLGLSLRRANLWHTLGAGYSWTPSPRALRDSAQMGLGIFLAAVIAHLLGGGHWYWASLGAIAAVSGIDAYSKVARGLQRSVGTCVGVLLTATVLIFEPPVWAILVVAIVGQICIELVILRNYAIGMVFMTVTALLMVHMVSPEPASSLLLDRVAMTALGAGIGAVQSILFGIFAGRERKLAA